MSDEAIRSAERTRQAEGLEEEERLRQLHEQVRGGALSMQTVTIAAAVGDPLASEYLGGDPVVIDSVESTRAAMKDVSNRQAVWLAVGAARSVLPVWEETYPEEDRPRLAVEAAEAWVREPSQKSAAASRAAAASREAAIESEAKAPNWRLRCCAWAAWAASQAGAAGAAGAGEAGSAARAWAAAAVESAAWAWAAEAAEAAEAVWAPVHAELIAQAWRWEEVVRG